MSVGSQEGWVEDVSVGSQEGWVKDVSGQSGGMDGGCELLGSQEGWVKDVSYWAVRRDG